MDEFEGKTHHGKFGMQVWSYSQVLDLGRLRRSWHMCLRGDPCQQVCLSGAELRKKIAEEVPCKFVLKFSSEKDKKLHKWCTQHYECSLARALQFQFQMRKGSTSFGTWPMMWRAASAASARRSILA